MRINLKIECVWEPSKEPLSEFRERYYKYQAHVEELQLKGILPRNNVVWEISKASRDGALKVGPIVLPPPEPKPQGEVCCYPPHPILVTDDLPIRKGPVLVHSSGRRLYGNGWADRVVEEKVIL